jgi:hypothetical protein
MPKQSAHPMGTCGEEEPGPGRWLSELEDFGEVGEVPTTVLGD